MNEREYLDTSLDHVVRTPETEMPTNGTENDLNGNSSSNRTTVVVIQTPYSITTNSSNENIAPTNVENEPQTLSETTTSRTYHFDLPSERGNDINEIHRVLRSNTDSAIATAATIALYNRRLTNESNVGGTTANITTSANRSNSNGNQLLISRVTINNESEETPTPQNILISYDNLQPVPPASLIQNGINIGLDDSVLSSDTTSSEDPSLSIITNESLNTPETTTNFVESEQTASTSETDLTIKLKFLDDTQKLVKTWLNTTVGDFKRKYFSDLLTNGKIVRLIYQGQLLRDDTRSLVSYGIHDQCVLHCHVGNRPYANSSTQGTNSELNSNDGSRPNLVNDINMGSIRARMITTGFAWFDFVFLLLWNSLVTMWNWANVVDENNNISETNIPLRRRCVNLFKKILRTILSCLLDFRVLQRIGMRTNLEEEHRFNPGFFFGLILSIKFTSLWVLVFFYPQIADPRGIVLLSIFTVVASLFFFFNRTPLPQRIRQID